MLRGIAISYRCFAMRVSAMSIVIGLCLSLAIGSAADAADVGIGNKHVKWGWGEGEGPAGNYDFPNEECKGNNTDPVGVLFVGKRAGTSNVGWHLEMHNGLDRGVGVANPITGEKHSLFVRNDKGGFDCKVLNTANANAGDTSDRHHIRLWGIPGSEYPEVMTVGTPHHEDYLDNGECGLPNHAVDEYGSVGAEHGPNASGFDWARHEIGFYFSHPNWKNESADYMGGDHKVVNEFWGNDEEFGQCDGQKAGSDGWGLVIWINQKTDPRTNARVSASQNGGELSGQFVGDGTENEWWFGYGTKSAEGVAGYQATTPVKASSSEGEVKVDASASKLASNTRYYARLFVRTEDGEVEEGAEISFWTLSRPVAAYSFDAGEGAIAEDLFGEHDGAIEGATWFENGKFGKALSFDGEDDCVTVEDAADLKLTEDFTLETWVRSRGDGTWEPILSKNGAYSIWLGEEAGEVRGYLREPDEDEGVAIDSEGVSENVWSHVAATYDGAWLRLYINGEFADKAWSEGAATTASPLSIGCAEEPHEGYWEGLIDEVRIYDRALGAAEIGFDKGGPVPY
jgi:hypothetical protein